MLEAARDNVGFSIPQSTPTPSINTGVSSSKNKSKRVFTTFDQSDHDSEDDPTTGVHVATSHSDQIKPGSHHKLPCPLQNHDHKIAACPDYPTLTPKDCCLKPKGINGVCKTRRCTEEKTIPQVLLCAVCTPWAAAKGWASFSILMCRRQEHGQD